ncbi:unnamed protein product, partial [Iphiclides podalirius]
MHWCSQFLDIRTFGNLVKKLIKHSWRCVECCANCACTRHSFVLQDSISGGCCERSGRLLHPRDGAPCRDSETARDQDLI